MTDRVQISSNVRHFSKQNSSSSHSANHNPITAACSCSVHHAVAVQWKGLFLDLHIITLGRGYTFVFVCDAVPYHEDEDVSAPGRGEMDQTLRVTECL